MQSQGQPLLLDLYPNSAVAYSVRKLRTAYTGNSIRVRRSSDNAEQNIGFSGNNLDTSALTTFCAGTDGFVTIWYDQSGNGINVAQGTATLQPQIVSGGSVLLVNGKPAIFSNGTASITKKLVNATLPNTSRPVSDFYAYKVNSIIVGLSYQAYYDGGALEVQRGFFGYQQSNGFDITYDGTILNAYPTTLNQTLATIIRNSASSQIYKNNTLTASGNSGIYTPLIGLIFGEDYSTVGAQSNVYHQEFIRYSGVSSNISAINTNINSYYGIY